MADADRGNRPLSPHLTIYRLQYTSALSILHRITGVALTLGAVLVVWWFLGAASGPEAFAFIDGLLSSWIGGLVLIGSAWALCYHAANGVRHLAWNLGYGFDLDTARRSGMAVVAVSVLATLFLILIA